MVEGLTAAPGNEVNTSRVPSTVLVRVSFTLFTNAVQTDVYHVSSEICSPTVQG